MNKSVIRLGDHCEETLPHFCISGSRDVFINGRPFCRQGDNFSEGKVMTQGSKAVFANGKAVARTGDLISCGAIAEEGSDNVFAG
ncbi:PAAR domain-containing protein [Wolbachia endosymbiont (group A) of Limnophora tigrina]|uniref:PAAR domain-containing protein n=1 Tax=Wolbachia endosymbiont (group A) of Limnophora tigrina TaxID=3139318 RepID=UPI0035B563E4